MMVGFIIFQILRAFRVEYYAEPVQPVLNTVMTPDRPVKLTFIPRDNEISVQEAQKTSTGNV